MKESHPTISTPSPAPTQTHLRMEMGLRALGKLDALEHLVGLLLRRLLLLLALLGRPSLGLGARRVRFRLSLRLELGALARRLLLGPLLRVIGAHRNVDPQPLLDRVLHRRCRLALEATL